MILKRLAIGESDFKQVITGDFYYVDKSLFIKEVIDRGDKILLLPRPRRFGKTLNISMLKYFYDCCPEPGVNQTESLSQTVNSISENLHYHLFDHLAIHNAGAQYLEKQGKHPVIFLTFKNIKDSDWETSYRKIQKLIRQEYVRHRYLLRSKKMESFEIEYFNQIIGLKGEREDYESSLENLLYFLNRYYGTGVVILIDEYDAPIHAGFSGGYYDEVIEFMRNFLCGGLKDTGQYLEKAVLTGIMRVAKESIFSGLNNPGVYTILAEEFDDKFGFTEKEVEKMLSDFNVLDMYRDVQQWYNGYVFGKETIYNPWSIINFLASEGKELEPYWLNTSNNDMIDSLLSKGGKELREEMEQLIRGETIEKAIDSNINFKQVYILDDVLWGFLLMGGYLKQTGRRWDEHKAKAYYRLAIPNNEVRVIYTRIVDSYFSSKIENRKLEIMLKALIDGDIILFEEMLKNVVAAVFSFHDFGNESEKVYHALVAGMLTWISGSHELKSNRESGYGRYDISIIPYDRQKIGYVIEFKKVRKNETLETAIDAAFQQIELKKYETELIERGIGSFKKLAIVFDGKEVVVRERDKI